MCNISSFSDNFSLCFHSLALLALTCQVSLAPLLDFPPSPSSSFFGIATNMHLFQRNFTLFSLPLSPSPVTSSFISFPSRLLYSSSSLPSSPHSSPYRFLVLSHKCNISFLYDLSLFTLSWPIYKSQQLPFSSLLFLPSSPFLPSSLHSSPYTVNYSTSLS